MTGLSLRNPIAILTMCVGLVVFAAVVSRTRLSIFCLAAVREFCCRG